MEDFEFERVIRFENRFFIVVNDQLIDAQTKQASDIPYTYVRDYTDNNVCFIIIKNRFYKWIKEQKVAVEWPTEMLCQNSRFTCYYTKSNRKNNYVFLAKVDGTAAVIGSSFQPIYDNLYKIGRYAYQIIDGELDKLCECMEFEKIGVRIEISAEESGASEMQAFQKFGNRWEVVNRWLPGNIVPSSNKSNLKK